MHRLMHKEEEEAGKEVIEEEVDAGESEEKKVDRKMANVIKSDGKLWIGRRRSS